MRLLFTGLSSTGATFKTILLLQQASITQIANSLLQHGNLFLANGHN